MPYEAEIPEEQRRFLSIDLEFDMAKFFYVPVGFYILWLTVYFMINFVIAAKRIKERNFENMYGYYLKKKWAYDLVHKFGPGMGPVIFLSFHFLFFFVCHIFSMFCFYSFYWHTISILFWLTWSVWNGSCFYMDYFSKKYELSLQRLEEVE
jgi:hypothetical protein